MKNLLFAFEDLASDKAVKAVSKEFGKAGANVVTAEKDPKVKRSSGINYRELNLTFADGQTVTMAFKQTGDVFQAKVNGKVQPIKSQDDHKGAIIELTKVMDAGRTKFQAALAKTRAELPKGVRTAAPKMEVALKTRVSELDEAIGAAQEQIAGLRAELGDQANLDSVGRLAALQQRRDPEGKGDAPMQAALAMAEQIVKAAAGDAVLDSALDLSLAKLELEKALDAVETNLPINESAGNLDQAELERESAKQLRDALAILDAAISYQTQHKTFSAACSEAIKYAEKQGFDIDDDDWHIKVATGPRKPDEGKTNSYSIALTKGGKEQKKALQMQVYGKGDHGYELNCYIA